MYITIYDHYYKKYISGYKSNKSNVELRYNQAYIGIVNMHLPLFAFN